MPKVDRYGPGIGDAYVCTAAHRLSEQLTYGRPTDLDTALATIAEMQEQLGRERQSRADLERTIQDLERRAEPDHPALNEAQRALFCLTRGDCISRRHDPRSDTFRTHAAVEAYHCRGLAHGTPTLDEALRAIVELCSVVHRMQHEAEERGARIRDQVEHIEDLAGDVAYLEGAEAGLREVVRALTDAVPEMAGRDLETMASGLLVATAREAIRRLTGRSFIPHAPDPWDEEYEQQERAAIATEPVSVWTRVRCPLL